MARKKTKTKEKKLKKANGSVGGKADVHAHEEGKRNKSLLGHNAIFTPEVTVSYTHLTLPTKRIV